MAPVHYSYDVAGRLSGVGHGVGGGSTSSFGWAGKVNGSIANPGGFTVSYGYDRLGRRLWADNTLDALDVGVGDPVQYDANGNIRRMKVGAVAASDYGRERTGTAELRLRTVNHLQHASNPSAAWELRVRNECPLGEFADNSCQILNNLY